MNQRNYTIDILRILGAFCVVVLHSPLGLLPNALALGLRLGSRWAVPFFFLVSGYLVARPKSDGHGVNVNKSLNNLIAIFVVSNIIYLIFFLVDNNPATSVDLTFAGLLIGQTGHLWFIGASIFGLLLLQYIANRYTDKSVLLVAGGVFLIIVSSSGYSKVSGISIQSEAARYLTAIPFLFVGYLISQHSAVLPRLSVTVCILGVLVGFGLECGEAILLYLKTGSSPHNQELLFGTAIMALSLFYFCLMLPVATEWTLASTGKIYSLLIYLYHPLIILVLFNKLALGKYSEWFYYTSPLLVFSILFFILKLLRRATPRVFAVLSGQ